MYWFTCLVSYLTGRFWIEIPTLKQLTFHFAHFSDYSTDLPGPNTIKGINGNTKVIGIGTLMLTSPNGGELVLRDVFHAPGLPYSLLSLGQLMMAGNTILSMILIASLRTALDSALNPNLHQLSALQAPSFTFVSISLLQNPTLQPVRTKLRYGMHMLATSQPPIFLILPKLQSYQKASKQLSLAPFQILASGNLVLKASRHDYRTPHLRGALYFR